MESIIQEIFVASSIIVMNIVVMVVDRLRLPLFMIWNSVVTFVALVYLWGSFPFEPVFELFFIAFIVFDLYLALVHIFSEDGNKPEKVVQS